LKYGNGKGRRRSVGPIVWKMEKYYKTKMDKGISYMQEKERRLRIGNILRRNCLLKHVIEGKREGT
jgi:hypothetical protein